MNVFVIDGTVKVSCLYMNRFISESTLFSESCKRPYSMAFSSSLKNSTSLPFSPSFKSKTIPVRTFTHKDSWAANAGHASNHLGKDNARRILEVIPTYELTSLGPLNNFSRKVHSAISLSCSGYFKSSMRRSRVDFSHNLWCQNIQARD